MFFEFVYLIYSVYIYKKIKMIMKLEDAEYELLYKKLEYTFKKSENPLVDKIATKANLTEDDIKLLLRKLEYRFRKGSSELILKLAKAAKIEDYSPVKYSSLAAKNKRELKDGEEKKLKHLESFTENTNKKED